MEKATKIHVQMVKNANFVKVLHNDKTSEIIKDQNKSCPIDSVRIFPSPWSSWKQVPYLEA